MKKKILIPSAILVALTIGGITMAVQPTKPVKVPKADQATIHQAPAITIIPGPSPAPAPEVPVTEGTTPVTTPTPPDSSPVPPDQPTPVPPASATAPAPAPAAPVLTITPGTP